MKRITVIIPCYNSADFIAKAIDSVLIQKENILEIICVDDCSSDKTVEVIKRISFCNEIVKLVEKKVNSGPATSRNIGVDMAQGELIAFLDSDDSWCQNKIATQLKFIDEGYDCVFSGFQTNNYLFCHEPISSIREISINELVFRNYISTSSVLMRKGKNRFADGWKYSEDYEFWLRLCAQGKKMGFISNPLYIRSVSVNSSSLSSRIFYMQLGEIKALLKNSSHYKFLILPALIFSLFKFTRRCLLNFKLRNKR